MTDKEYQKLKVTCLLIIGLFAGLLIGSLVTGLRYDSEIRTDQLRLKGQVEEIREDDATIQDIIKKLSSQLEQLKLERQELRELKILFSKKGEKDVKKKDEK